MTPKGRGKSTSGKKRQPREPRLDGVLVKVGGTKQARTLEVAALGNVKLTEAPTLLKLAAKQAEKQLGLE